MPKPKVYVTRRINEDALRMIAKATDMEVWPGEDAPLPDVLLQKVRDIDGLLTTVVDRVDRELFEAAKRLKVVSNMAAGYDNVVVAEATRRGIPVGNTPGVLSETTADLTFAILLAAARRVCESERWHRAGNWNIAFQPTAWLGYDVHHATIGIIGMGKIGQEVAKRARGFDMRIVYHSRTRKPQAERQYNMRYTDLPTLLKESDFVTLHLPLTPETRHFIGKAQLEMMKPTAILVNAARGAVVDQDALYHALKEKRIAAAALDVYTPEPLLHDSPLFTLDNVVLTPHIGSATHATRRKMAMLAAENLLAGLKGEKLRHCINPQVQTHIY